MLGDHRRASTKAAFRRHCFPLKFPIADCRISL
jgi:hypothetical protein